MIVEYVLRMILKQANEFLSHLAADLNFNKIVLLPDWDIDHLCYRAPSDERYEVLKNIFSSFSELLIESPVNGRLISTFKLDVPIAFQDWLIDLIELPAPKAGKVTPEGFEHIEVVCDVPLTELQSQYSHLNLDLGGLRKPFNQELEIVLGQRNIKFHHMSLESVIRFEATGRVNEAVALTRISVLDDSYQVFLAEEKLRKYASPEFRKALGLENDPYSELLRLQKLSIADLRATLKA